MEYIEWEPHYRGILADFGYDPRRDEESAAVLERRVPDPAVGLARLVKLRNRNATILGAAPLTQQETGDLKMADMVLVADSASATALRLGIEPFAILTDLDGDLEAIRQLARIGAVVLVHAHGDNIVKVAGQWDFGVRTLGTCQCRPFGKLSNFGGFTDGDRAVILAKHFGAATVELVGFDFAHPVAKEGSDPEVKARKLTWARKLIAASGIPAFSGGERIV